MFKVKIAVTESQLAFLIEIVDKEDDRLREQLKETIPTTNPELEKRAQKCWDLWYDLTTVQEDFS